jgi:hypothetical protein
VHFRNALLVVAVETASRLDGVADPFAENVGGLVHPSNLHLQSRRRPAFAAAPARGHSRATPGRRVARSFGEGGAVGTGVLETGAASLGSLAVRRRRA